MSTNSDAATTADVHVRNAAAALARCCLEVIAQRFPHKLDHLILDDRDLRLPSAIHPIFDGS